MVSLSGYSVGSTLLAAAVVSNAWYTRRQFYPTVLYLATSKLTVCVLGNMAFVLTLLFGHLSKKVFLGGLRPVEVEHLLERSRDAVMETCLAMTIFRQDFDAKLVSLFTALLFIKIFHWLSQDRVEFIEQSPAIPVSTHLRILSLLAILMVVDLSFLYVSVSYTMERGPSVLLLFAFEYVILASTVVSTVLKYILHMVDMRMEGRWERKGVCVFYLELVTDLLHLLVYLVFFGIIFSYYGLPLHIVRDLYLTFKNFRKRIADFIRYRRVTANMNERFPDASAEELARGDRICIICREEMTAAKRLPCSHLFHLHCLRSWLERQQTCPTCRSPVETPATPTPPPAAPAAAHAAPGPAAAPAPGGGMPANAAPAANAAPGGAPQFRPPHAPAGIAAHGPAAHAFNAAGAGPQYMMAMNPWMAAMMNQMAPGAAGQAPGQATAPFAAAARGAAPGGQGQPPMMPMQAMYGMGMMNPYAMGMPMMWPQQQPGLGPGHFHLLQQQIEFLQNQLQNLADNRAGMQGAVPAAPSSTSSAAPSASNPASSSNGALPTSTPSPAPTRSSEEAMQTEEKGKETVLQSRQGPDDGVITATGSSLRNDADEAQDQVRRRRLERFQNGAGESRY